MAFSVVSPGKSLYLIPMLFKLSCIRTKIAIFLVHRLNNNICPKNKVKQAIISVERSFILLLVYPYILRTTPKIGKADIINCLGQVNQYVSYLEIASRTTGHRFGKVSKEIFSLRQRVLYNCPMNHSDGLQIDYTSADLTGEDCLKEIATTGKKFDVVFVDPYHSYKTSKSNLEYAIQLLNLRGVLVVHDCNPPNQSLTSPEFRKGGWLGQTYLAFLDFVNERPDLEYCVVDIDWGVGIIWRADKVKLKHSSNLIPDRPYLDSLDVHDWEIFNRNRNQILRLISVRQFFRNFA